MTSLIIGRVCQHSKSCDSGTGIGISIERESVWILLFLIGLWARENGEKNVGQNFAFGLFLAC